MIDKYINQHGKRLYGLCLTLCANSADADDLYQDTWLKVVKNFSQYDTTREFEPWLTKICINIYRNILRRIGKSPILSRFSSNEEKRAVMEGVLSVLPEDYSSLHEAIDQLPEKLRMTIILFYFRDMDLKSTALVLNIPVGTVKSRLSKSRKLLKEALKNEADIPF
ncbi:ECF RNA polymerase sigma factor SigW [Oxobacter pfennigii]|uniref:ECF RNA polymerase sigma factor SigW n=1 Tax=Oxobacter pfennigii TaxID=36849 RepID=A0A0P8WKU6_9CLOT|nr:sigma-70 family RNA polymerase sigma factor [Oxobacter pfennigii]KPU42979.1 ECF RNA polymerase sigma factor SigW [Oxobacter pfennigii]